MKQKVIILASSSLLVVCFAVLFFKYNQERQNRTGEVEGSAQREIFSGRKGKSDTINQKKKPKGRFSEKEERTGLVVEYDKLLQNDELVSIFKEVDPLKAKKLEQSNIKAYIRDGSIVMLKKNEGCFKSMSRAVEAKRIIFEEGGGRLTHVTSEYFKLDDDAKMHQLLDYLQSWSGADVDRVEHVFVMIEIVITRQPSEATFSKKGIEVGDKYPAYLQVGSSGPPAVWDSGEDRVYPRELTIKRYFRLNAIIPQPIKRNPLFDTRIGAGIYIEEPSPKAIELYGVRH